MNEVFVLDELDSSGIVLDDLKRDERRALTAVGNRMRVEWRPDGSARVGPCGYVGSVRLSVERAVAVATKVPVGNLLMLASLAFRSAPLPPSVGSGLYETSEPSDWLALLVVAEVEALVSTGLRSSYVTVVEDLPYIRGRMRFEGSARSSLPAGLATCEFSDFIADTPENRVLRATLEALGSLRLLPGLRSRLHEVLRAFGTVPLVSATPALLGAIRLTRLNQHYEPALELCRIVLEGIGLEYPGSTTTAPAFFFPMEKVFEAGVTNYLRCRLPGVRSQVGDTVKVAGGSPAHSLNFRPDVTIGDPPVLVLDTKYARPEIRNAFGGLSFDNSHVYQAAFYARVLDCPGVLIYPRVDRDVATDFVIRGTTLNILTVDLSTPGLAGLDALANTLQHRLAAQPAVAVTAK